MKKKRVLVLSIDAMTGEDLAFAESLPNFGRLIRNCALATQVESVFPSLTYPCHVSMATGCSPAHTRVWNNEIFLPDTLKRPWYFYDSQIARPTIFESARQAGISTGCVMWPCMGNGPIDVLVPEIWGKTPDEPFLEPFCSAGSEGFIREIWPLVSDIPQGFNQPMFDTFVIAMACEVIRRQRSELLYVHICQVDNAKHYYGLGSPEVQQALLRTDQLLGQLICALDDVKVRDDTNIVLCSDHGQQPVTHVSYPNRLLAAHGFLSPAHNSDIETWRAQVQSACLSAFVYADSRQSARQALELLSLPENKRTLGIADVLTKETAERRFHLTGDFSAVLLGQPGIYFHNALDIGPFLLPIEESGLKYKANHGHDPLQGEKPFFLIFGPDARPGVRIQTMKLIDEAPTIAALMGFPLPHADGHPQTCLLAES